MIHCLESRRGTPALVIDHDAFGLVRASGCDVDGSWLWESLDLLDTYRGRADLTYSAGPDGPGPAHRAQLDVLLHGLDALTEAAAPLVLRELAGLGCQFRADSPRMELEWCGAHLTNRAGEFCLDYSARNWPHSLITVEFEQARPTCVRIHH